LPLRPVLGIAQGKNPENKRVESSHSNRPDYHRLKDESWEKWDMVSTESAKVIESVASQLMNGDKVMLDVQRISVRRVGSGRLRMVQFKLDGHIFEAIEQNPEKPSRWGQLARAKHQVVQFRDVQSHKYVAVSVDGKLTEYGRD
jgi:hypothetical protein